MATRLKSHFASFLDFHVLKDFLQDGHTPFIKLLMGLMTRKDKDGKEVEVYEVQSRLLYADPNVPSLETLFANPTLPKVSAMPSCFLAFALYSPLITR